MLSKIKRVLKSPNDFCFWVLGRKICRVIPDEIYIKLKYRCILGRWPNLDNPQYFSEKLQWLKLHDRNELYCKLVDKYYVRKYIEEKIGSDYLVPLIGVWNSPEEIEWEKLPNKFVLKTANGSHTNIICTDKSKLNIKESIKKLHIWQNGTPTFYYGREWPYKYATTTIIAEEYIESTNEHGLLDYKFMCFSGKVDHVMICSDRNTGQTKFDHFDKNWNFLRYQYVDANKPENYTQPKPKLIDEMFKIAELLSKPFPFVRVDLYCENNKIYFGELTFYPQSGFDTDYTVETDLYFGKLLDLSNNKKVFNEE